MDLNFLSGFQIVTDVIICAGILILLIRFRNIFKPELPGISEKSMAEFRQLLDESKNAADKFLGELEQEKKTLKNLLASVDEKEKRLKILIEQVESIDGPPRSDVPDEKETTDSFSDQPYREILNLARKGLSQEDIARQLGLPEGEIGLILNLSRSKSR